MKEFILDNGAEFKNKNYNEFVLQNLIIFFILLYLSLSNLIIMKCKNKLINMK